jgi:hypothetical protein
VCPDLRRLKLGPYGNGLQELSEMQRMHKRIPFDDKASKYRGDEVDWVSYGAVTPVSPLRRCSRTSL